MQYEDGGAHRNPSPNAVTARWIVIYDDVSKAIHWLCDVFGFRERLRAAREDGTVEHAQLSIGDGGVMLGASRTGTGFAAAADSTELRPPRESAVNQSLLVRVQDVERHYEHTKERGAKILQPPTTYPFGERQYTAVDLGGHRWTFSQPVADVKPEEWGAKVSHLTSGAALLPRPRLCYLEIPATDLARSVKFYEAVFGPGAG